MPRMPPLPGHHLFFKLGQTIARCAPLLPAAPQCYPDRCLGQIPRRRSSNCALVELTTIREPRSRELRPGLSAILPADEVVIEPESGNQVSKYPD
jgi:hypothetical protein